MFHHHAHLHTLRVKAGDIVDVTTLLGTVGKSGLSPNAGAHDHYEISREKPPTWTFYPSGKSKEWVASRYIDPLKYIDETRSLPCKWTNKTAGNQWLTYYKPQNVYHPGRDLNSGYGDQDLGNEVRSTCYGRVVYAKHDSGWGYHVWIEELTKPELPKPMFPITLKVQPVFNNQKWATEAARLQELKDAIYQRSGGRIAFELLPSVYSSFTEIPFGTTMSLDGKETVEAPLHDWYVDSVYPLARNADVIMLICNRTDWKDPYPGNGITYGYMHPNWPTSFPALISMLAEENDRSWKFPELHALTHYGVHETVHALYNNSFTGDRTHELDYAGRLNEAFDHFDYQKINEQLAQRKDLTPPMYVFQLQGDATLYFAVGKVLVPFANSYQAFLADFKDAIIVKLPYDEFAKFKVAQTNVVKAR